MPQYFQILPFRFSILAIVFKNRFKLCCFEEVAVATGGYDIYQVEICIASLILDKTPLELGLRNRDILILALERNGITSPNREIFKILLGDRMTRVGKLETVIRDLFLISKLSMGKNHKIRCDKYSPCVTIPFKFYRWILKY